MEGQFENSRDHDDAATQQIKDDHQLALQLAEEDEAYVRQTAEDERIARDLDRQEREQERAQGSSWAPAPHYPPHPLSTSSSAASFPYEGNLPGRASSGQNHDVGLVGGQAAGAHQISSRRGSGGEEHPDPDGWTRLEFDRLMAQQMAREEGGEGAGDGAGAANMPGGFPAGDRLRSTSGGEGREQRVSEALHNPMSAVLAHLFSSLGTMPGGGNTTAAPSTSPTRSPSRNNPPRPPQNPIPSSGFSFGRLGGSGSGEPRVFTFGYDSNGGFYTSNNPTPHPLLAALQLTTAVRPDDANPNDPYASYRDHFRPLLMTQFGHDLGGALFNAVPSSYEDLVALAERLGPAQARGAKDDEIKKLPVIKWPEQTDAIGGKDHESGSGKTCAICMSDFETGEDVLKIPSCSHMFHEPCGSQWLKVNRTCPICRKDIRATASDSTGSNGSSANRPSGNASTGPNLNRQDSFDNLPFGGRW
ncbi:hypothetical protein DFS34DRAFT_603921 [Phlyctochytrium arcticum]|nr:hypothetical protein DFS34DRAFT_603921 [Phlyctochytrium arcticum]